MYENRIKEDWDFTNNTHKKLVDPLFNNKFGIKLEAADISSDRNKSIDYIGHKDNKTYSFQERIRRAGKYTNNSEEFTLRFQRNNSYSENQKSSEFFKFKAQFLFYAIINEKESDFRRYCVINLANLRKSIDNGEILIDGNKNNKKHQPYLSNDKPVCVVKGNYEQRRGNSSFLIFNLNDIAERIDAGKPKQDRIVLRSYGYKELRRIEKEFDFSSSELNARLKEIDNKINQGSINIRKPRV